MSYVPSTYHSKVYRDFKEIESNDHRQVIRYYEQFEDQIHHLDFEEYYEIVLAYVDALFEIGAYQRHLLMVDVVIEHTILNNIQFRKGEDLYRSLLFKKAASLHNTLEYEKADYILRELIKIDPYDRDAILFLKRCLRKKHNAVTHHSRATSIFLIMIAALVIALEVLFIRPFYQIYAQTVEYSRITIFMMGLFALVGGELYQRICVSREVNQFVQEIKAQKGYS